jgi:two-component system nitrogen regulation sensor histidine kinase NtrY
VFSHELRNSLTPMASMTDTLLSNEHLDPQQTKLVLTRINLRSSHLLDFIGRYADISQLSTPNMSWFDVATLIDEAKTVLPNNATIIIKGEKKCFGDRSQLSMVFTNLFKNSQQACDDAPLIINVKVYFDNAIQTIELVDNGTGFSNLDNVLTPFYSTKTEGNGIGLALCREIVHQHGGQLTVSNSRIIQGAIISMNWKYVRLKQP